MVGVLGKGGLMLLWSVAGRSHFCNRPVARNCARTAKERSSAGAYLDQACG